MTDVLKLSKDPKIKVGSIFFIKNLIKINKLNMAGIFVF